jgi:hypothetical protein
MHISSFCGRPEIRLATSARVNSGGIEGILVAEKGTQSVHPEDVRWET